MPRHQATPIRRGPGYLWAKAGRRLGRLAAPRQNVDEALFRSGVQTLRSISTPPCCTALVTSTSLLTSSNRGLILSDPIWRGDVVRALTETSGPFPFLGLCWMAAH
jgi:hypothetical protein